MPLCHSSKTKMQGLTVDAERRERQEGRDGRKASRLPVGFTAKLRERGHSTMDVEVLDLHAAHHHPGQVGTHEAGTPQVRAVESCRTQIVAATEVDHRPSNRSVLTTR